MQKLILNKFNDPEDFRFAKLMTERLLELPDGTETTTSILFSEVAPGWEPEDVDLSSIDAELRRQAHEQNIALITPIQYRNCVMGKPFSIPFRIRKMGQAKK